MRVVFNAASSQVSARDTTVIEETNDWFYHLGEERREQFRRERAVAGGIVQSTSALGSVSSASPFGGWGGSSVSGQLSPAQQSRPMSQEEIAEQIRNSQRLRSEEHLLSWEKDALRWLKKVLLQQEVRICDEPLNCAMVRVSLSLFRSLQWLNPKRDKRLPLYFSVPVTRIWSSPAFVSEYEKKIHNPMDLTSLECKVSGS